MGKYSAQKQEFGILIIQSSLRCKTHTFFGSTQNDMNISA